MDIDRDPATASGRAAARLGTSTQEMILNMGPQRPGARGVLRMALTIEGERIIG